MRTLIHLLAVIVMVSVSAKAQDEIFIYGKVTTIDSKVYEGPIRWGKEEVYWVDIFNAAKESNENLQYLSKQDREELDDRNQWDQWEGNWGGNFKRWLGNWDREYGSDYTHQFACQFGEIKSIKPSGRNDVQVIMQNGKRYDLEGEGYNDVGTSVRVMDPELGEVDIDWGRIEKIDFMKTPKQLANRFGKPLYGTVDAYGQKFTGYIQWDHDERLSIDKLDGDTDDGDISIEFGKIKSIERQAGSSKVILKSGRELRMDDSNDVDSGNRGIIIMNNELVAIDVPWREFDKVTFEEAPAAVLSSYDQFAVQQELSGTVTNRSGEKLSGRIIFDLDEENNYELLQGKQDDYEFITPFRNVKRVEVLSQSRSVLELRSGKKITLEDAQDVNERNQGVLVFDKANKSQYLRWDEVQSIDFN